MNNIKNIIVIAGFCFALEVGAQDFSKLDAYWVKVDSNIINITPERKESLKSLAKYVANSLKSKQSVDLTFICDQNSRMSHLAQIWAAAAVNHLDLMGVRTFSAGIEATAFNANAIASVERSGCIVEHIPDPILLQRLEPSDSLLKWVDAINLNNKVMMVSFAASERTMTLGKENNAKKSAVNRIFCFSKTLEHPYNPKSDFAAVITCSNADVAFPVVKGANFRVSIPYVDPKISDATNKMQTTYDESCFQIATEMLFVMKQVKVTLK